MSFWHNDNSLHFHCDFDLKNLFLENILEFPKNVGRQADSAAPASDSKDREM